MRKPIKYIFFDCMETLVDLHRLPTMRDYAAWAYEGSGLEGYWEDLDEFFRYYILSKQELESKLPEHADYELRGRFSHLVQLSLPQLPYGLVESTADILYRNYWHNYKSGSYVRDEVKEALIKLKERFRLGVVSNFMVIGGIEEMLEIHGIRGYFDFVVTSVAEGWKKPHQAIYQKALELACIEPEQVIFVGDDYVNDYMAPLEMGMWSVLLDRFNRHPELNRHAEPGHPDLSIPPKQKHPELDTLPKPGHPGLFRHPEWEYRVSDFTQLVGLLSG